MFTGEVEIKHVLTEIQRRLMEDVLAGHDAGLCLIGGRRTGKSSCLLGASGDQVITGLLPQFAEAYFKHQGQNAIRLIELAIVQIYKDQVYDLLLPHRDGANFSVKRSSRGISAHGRTYHVARNQDEFSSLVAGALSVKVALSLQSDIFLQCAHMHIHCVCQCQEAADAPPIYQSALTFVEVGTSILHGGGDISDGDECKIMGFAVEQSLVSFRNSVTADDGRTLSAQICNSVLTSLLADMLASSIRTIWLGCISSTLVDVDETECTLALLATARQFRKITVQAKPNPTIEIYPQLLAIIQERRENTNTHSMIRECWLNASGMKALSSFSPTNNGPCLTNLSSDVRFFWPFGLAASCYHSQSRMRQL